MTYPIPTHTTLSGMHLMLHDLVKQESDSGSELLSMLEHYIHRCCRVYYTLNYSEQQDIAQEASIKLILPSSTLHP